jgi:hypothetical protein
LKHIASYKKYQGNCHANTLIANLTKYCKNKYEAMLVGTVNLPSIVSFGKNCGFKKSYEIENFFTGNNDHPIIEQGVKLVDMVYLRKQLYVSIT